MKAILNFIKKNTIIFVLILLVVFFSAMRPSTFPTAKNMFSILRQSSIVGIATMGMMFTLLAGGIDLSISSVISMSCIISAVMVGTYQLNPVLSFICAIAICGFVGTITGYIIVATNIPAMIATLAMQTILQGLTYLICNGKPVYNVPESVKVIGQGYIGIIPIPVIVMVIILILAAITLNTTRFGRNVYATGSNEEAARYSGINTKLIRVLTFTISGMLAGLAGVIMLGRIATGQPTAGKGLEMDCLTAAVIGGVSLVGGEGRVSTCITGIFIISVLTNGMTIMNINEYYQLVITGCILLAAVCFDGIQKQGLFQKKKAKV